MLSRVGMRMHMRSGLASPREMRPIFGAFPVAPCRSFSVDPVYERAPMFPLDDNTHLRPEAVPGLPKKYADCHWTWVTGIDSALMRPPGWRASECTVEQPWADLTGNPLRTSYITSNDLRTQGFIKTGLTVAAYCIDRRNGNMAEFMKSGEPHKAVDFLLAPIRFSDGIEPDPSAENQMPTLNKSIEVIRRRHTPPYPRDRFPVHSTRISYLHKDFVPDGVMGVQPQDTRFEVEYLANDLSGWIYEVVFQAPAPDFEEAWDNYGKMMMSSEKGMFLRMRPQSASK